MKTYKSLIIATVLYFSCISSASSTGLYLNIPGYLTNIDTTRTVLSFHEAQLSMSGGRASFLYGEVDFRVKKRVSLRFGLSYLVIDKENRIIDGLGDGFAYSELQALGDTLGLTGIFLRSDLRVPMGGRGLYPFSYASLDGGIGIEGRIKLPLFSLRASSTYYLSGERKRAPGIALDNYLLSSLSLDFPLFIPLNLAFSVLNVNFRHGGARGLYDIKLHGSLSSRFLLSVGAMLDSGSETERVFDSMIYLSFGYRFPPSKVKESKSKEGEGPVSSGKASPNS